MLYKLMRVLEATQEKLDKSEAEVNKNPKKEVQTLLLQLTTVLLMRLYQLVIVFKKKHHQTIDEIITKCVNKTCINVVQRLPILTNDSV